MTLEQLDAIQARADAATEGPWRTGDFGYPGQDEPSSIIIHRGPFNWRAINEGEYVAAMPAWDSQEGANAEFIAHARTDVPALLALVREQAAAIDRVRGLHPKVCEINGDNTDCKESGCPMLVCGPCGEDWPCPTIAALTTTEGA